MNPSAIYSKSGKGVQEAAGKTSLLSRPDRALLSAIDGRATLADVAQKIGKPFDQIFERLIAKLDKDGFIREVSAGTAAPAGAATKPGGKASAKPAAKRFELDDPSSDLDFSMLGGFSKPAPKAPPPPMPAAPPPPKEQESALFKARQEAEAKAQAERDRARKEAEDKVRAETESRLRAEAEAKARADAEARIAAAAEAKIKAAREAAVKAAAEAKAKAEAEAKRAREEAERVRKEAEEKAERVRKEAEEKAERERKAREEAERIRKEAEERERKAREEAERARKALEEERKRREEEERSRKAKEEEERAERRRREKEEEEERRRKREEEESREAAEREARRKAREEEEAGEEALAAAERAARIAKTKEKEKQKEKQKQKPVEPEKAEAPGGGFADSLMADLDFFNSRGEEETKAKEEGERKAKVEAETRARDEAERREKEEAARRAKEEKQRAKEEKARKKREEEDRLRREEEEEKERIGAEEERRRKEADERERRAKEQEAVARKAQSSSAGGGYVGEDKRRQRALEVGPRDPSLARRQRRSWGKPVAMALFLVLAIALGVAHVMPIATADYERAASAAVGRPVRIGSAKLRLITGLQLRLENVSAGDVKIGRVIAHPSIASLTDTKKAFSTIELEGVTLPQEALGAVLFSRAAADNFAVARVFVRKLELAGPLTMPEDLQAEVSFNPNGTVRLATLRGDQGLVARLEPRGQNIEFSLDASSFTLPFAPALSLSQFGMKGSATAQGLQVKQWDGQALDGTLTGTARVRWGGTWTVDGVVTARGINAAVFAPALLSEGRGEGTGKFAMSGVEPGKLASGARLDGNFTVNKGVLGSFDLSRAIQTGGKQAQGRTRFTEMNGQVSYDGGEVELRNVTIGAGALNAGASAVISPKGALSGRIVADVRTASQTLRATLLLGGTLKEPQVRN